MNNNGRYILHSAHYIKKQNRKVVYELKKAALITLYPAKKVSEMLGIQPSTLRKYSGLIDKLNQEPYFDRDATNARIYDDMSIKLLKRIVALNGLPDMTLEKSVEIALLEEKTTQNESSITAFDMSHMSLKKGDISPIQTFFTNVMTKQAEEYTEKNRQVIALALDPLTQKTDSLLEKIETSNTLITQLLEENSALKEEVATQKKMLEKITEDTKRSFFKKWLGR